MGPRSGSAAARRPLAGQRWVVTAGPTREYLDAIRFLTNASTGRMGIELARAASRLGAEVLLLLGPTHLAPPSGLSTVRVSSTRDLLRAAREGARGADAILFAAAPADWRPRRTRRGKPPREASSGAVSLELVPTDDVAAALGRAKHSAVHVGFALEVGGGVSRARAKLLRKRFDAIVLNGPENFGPGGGPARWIGADGEDESLPTTSKSRLAAEIVRRTAGLVARKRTR